MGPFLSRCHSCCTRGGARAHWLTGTSGRHKATLWGWGRDGQEAFSGMLGVWSICFCVCLGELDSAELIIQHMNHTLFFLALHLLLYQCMCVHLCEHMWVCVLRLSEEPAVYHVALQAARCPCTGHPHRKSIHKNGDYIGDGWPPAILLSLPVTETFLCQASLILFFIR